MGRARVFRDIDGASRDSWSQAQVRKHLLPSLYLLLSPFTRWEPRREPYHLLTLNGKPGPLLGTLYVRSHFAFIIILSVLQFAKHLYCMSGRTE